MEFIAENTLSHVYKQVRTGAAIALEAGSTVDDNLDGPVLKSVANYWGKHIWLRTTVLKPQTAPDVPPPIGFVLFFHGVKQHARGPEVLKMAKHVVDKCNVIWYGWDMQGHGRSCQLGDSAHPLPPTVIIDDKSLIEDALEFVRAVADTHPHLSFCISGHSFGGAVCTLITPTLQELYSDRYKGFCVSAPAIMTMFDLLPFGKSLPLRMRVFLTWSQCLAKCRPDIIPDMVIAPLRESVRRNSAYEALAADPLRFHNKSLAIGAISAGMSAFKLLKDPRFLGNIKVPWHISHGTSDKTCMIQGSKMLWAFASTPDTGKSLQFFGGATHNLLGDLVRISAFRERWAAWFTKALTTDLGDEEQMGKNRVDFVSFDMQDTHAHAEENFEATIWDSTLTSSP